MDSTKSCGRLLGVAKIRNNDEILPLSPQFGIHDSKLDMDYPVTQIRTKWPQKLGKAVMESWTDAAGCPMQLEQGFCRKC
jgi:hypothetical protein